MVDERFATLSDLDLDLERITASRVADRPVKMRMQSKRNRTAALVLLFAWVLGCGGGSGGSATGPAPGGPADPPPGASPNTPPDLLADAPPVSPGPAAMRRLTEAQYRASVADVLGEDVEIGGRFEPDSRRDGLLAVGTSFVSVTPAGFEQYDAIARSVAEQALAPERRAALVACPPASVAAADDACASDFVRRYGRRLLRRSLADDEIARGVAVARETATALGDFYAGLEMALATLLLSPEFLFRVENSEPDPDHAGRQRFTSTAMASRLSYLLWNTAPDEDLLAAGERGDLVDDALLAAELDRLLDSPRLEDGVRVFFSDLYGFDQIRQGLVRKDATLFPAYSQALIEDAEEQTLRVVAEHLVTEDEDYRGLFTTRRSFMSRALGVVYRVPVVSGTGFEPYEFPAGSDRAGVLTHLSLLALYSHPGRSSPTLRGKFVREVLLCQDVPPPPGNIDFSMFDDPASGTRRTARDRLQAHNDNPACAGCHGLMDPIGLGLEKMDSMGASRETENGAAIDPSGQLNGVAFEDAIGLGEAMAADELVGPCFVRSFLRFAVGREVADGEGELLDYVNQRLGESGYRMRELIRLIVMSDAFRSTSGPRLAVEGEEAS
ncbi:MAG: DUF1588 domain-containing protein [Deltaproteobacteria bacterium]|nr:DUF1588 domain-containing protein [Deltaproteobacteria bacterium]